MTHPDTLTIPRAVVEQALEALENAYSGSIQGYHEAFDNLHAALQPQAAAEPVNAWQIFGMDGEPMFIQQDEASAKRYEDAGHTVKRLSYFTTPPATQATPVNLQPAHDAVTIDLLNDRVMRQQAALTAALGALKNSVDTVWEEYTEAERKYAAYDSRRAKLDGMKAMAQAHTDAIAQIEALGE